MDESGLLLGYFRGPLDTVLAAIERAGFEGAVLELVGSPSEELFDFAEWVSARDPESSARNRDARHGGRQLGPIRFGGGPLYIPVSGDNLSRLRAIADRHAEPEVALALRVIAGDETLLDAPDVGDNDIWVSHKLADDQINVIRVALGDGLDMGTS